MNYTGNEPVLLTRDVQVIAVPAGNTVGLPEGTEVVITQALGGTYTLLVPTYGGLFRLASRDADAIGKEVRPEDLDSRHVSALEEASQRDERARSPRKGRDRLGAVHVIPDVAVAADRR